MIRDVNRLDLLDEIRINGSLSRFQLSKDPTRPTKILAVLAKGTKLSDQYFQNTKNELEALNKLRDGKTKTTFKLEPFAIPFDLGQLSRVTESMVSRASKLVYCPGTTDDSGTGCTPAASPADLMKYIREIYDLALLYKGKGRDDADQRVTEWLRHAPPPLGYNNDKWDDLAGKVDVDWIVFVNAKGKTLMHFAADPLYPVNIKVSHLGASIDGALRWPQPSHKGISIGDVTGWGGDLITFYNEWQHSKTTSGSKFCWETLARPGDRGTFKLRDLIEDADAFNISTTLKDTKTSSIADEIDAIFKPGGGYKTRFARFFQGRFGGTAANAATAAKNLLLASKFSLDLPIWKGKQLLITGKQPEDISPVDLDDFCKGFGDVLADIASSG